MKEPITIGIVGLGGIAQVAHLPVLSKMRGAKLLAVCDNDGPKARALAERFDVPYAVTDIEDLLELDDLDAVVVATPNHLHEPHVLSALAAKVHVLCERPLALNSRGVERILAASQRAGKMVHVANNHRFRTDVQGLDRFVRGGELGKITGIRAGDYRQLRSPEGWRMRRPEAGGGAFLDLGLPLLDLALWLTDFPDAVRVSAHMERAKGTNAVEQGMLVQITFANGLVFACDVASDYVGQDERWWFEVIATRGSARMAPLRVVKELNGRATDVSPSGAAGRESAFIQSYRAELAHFVAVVREEIPYEPPSDQVRLLKIVEAVYRSAEEDKEIRL
jgi:predicted dehydrogenase